ncbi:ATP-binding protein [Actinoallomurus sp. NPDC052274]|uniref:ATP-binding protein n=1 Tax=Actinoallomurus sp. NPDC052274 TaxID=3155420 RepID=UPI003443535F
MTALPVEDWTSPDRFTLDMHACPENVYLVRNLVDQAVESWGLKTLRDIGRLILTELATNAARQYPGALVNVWVHRPRGASVIELGVWDHDATTMPHIVNPLDADETGRGLFLIHCMTNGRLHWQASPHRGKVVWAQCGP